MTEKEKQEILDWIRSEHEAGQALNIHAVRQRNPDLLKLVYSVRPFWGWWQAIADAGLDYGNLKVELEEKVACRICGYEGLQLNTHLRARHGITTQDYREQFPDTEISSELHRARMRREGGKRLLPHWEPLYSDEYMMDRAYRYHRMGHRLRTTWVGEHDHNLWQHIHRQGITWESFVTGLSIPYTHELPPRGPNISREALLKGLRKVARELGETPGITLLTKRNHSLVTGVGHHFDSYDEALEAAGLPIPERPYPLRPELSPEAVLEELTQLAAAGHRITAIGINKTLGRYDLHQDVEKMGGYPAIRKKLGLAKPDPPRADPRHTRDEVIAAFQKQATEGEAYTVRGMKRGSDEDRGLLSSARYHFERWSDLLEITGLVTEHHAIPRARARRQRLLEELQRHHEAGEPLDHHEIRQQKAGKKLYTASRQVFGSWEKALIAAGLPVELGDKNAAIQQRILAEMRELHQTGHPLEARAMKCTPTGQDLYLRAKSTFESWKKAVLAAGFEWPQTADPDWMKEHRPQKERAANISPRKRDLLRAERELREQTVIEAIRERSRNKKTLWMRKIRREAEGKELYDTARRVFKSWKAALKAAGCKPEKRPARKVSKIVRDLELAYPIDPSTWESEPADGAWEAEEKNRKSDPIKAPPRGWRQSGKGEKQRTTPSRAKRRKKRK